MAQTLQTHEDNQLPIAELAQQLRGNSEHIELSVHGQAIELTHLAKPMWSPSPDAPDEVDVTKRELLTYYLLAAPALLPFLRDRPLTVKRYPDGFDGKSFMQRHIDDAPPFVETVEICTDAHGNNEPFLLCQNLETLIWLVNMNTVEFHPWYSRIDPGDTGLPTIFINSAGTLEMSVLNYPDWLAFDIDPNEEGGAEDQIFERTLQASGLIHQYLDNLGLSHFVKLSGRRGIHIFVPLERLYTYDQVRMAAKKMSDQLAEAHDDVFTTEWHIEKRQGKVFLDWHQNARGKSMAAPFSARGTAQANVSMPLTWEGLADSNPSDFTVLKALHRPAIFEENPWKKLLDAAQKLPASLIDESSGRA